MNKENPLGSMPVTLVGADNRPFEPVQGVFTWTLVLPFVFINTSQKDMLVVVQMCLGISGILPSPAMERCRGGRCRAA